MRRVLPALAVPVLVAALTACEPTGTEVTDTPRSRAASAAEVPGGGTTPGGESADAPAKAQVGDTLDLRGMTSGEKLAVTVLKIVDPATAKNQFMTPDAGSRLVSVQFKLVNTGSKPYDDSPSNGARLVDTDGQSFNATISDTTAGPALHSATISVGSTGSGWITFEVPKASKLAKVQFAMNSGFAGNKGEWAIP